MSCTINKSILKVKNISHLFTYMLLEKLKSDVITFLSFFFRDILYFGIYDLGHYKYSWVHFIPFPGAA